MCTPVSSINKIDRHDVTEILLKAALNTIALPFHMTFPQNISHDAKTILWAYLMTYFI
jgi:antitoxin component of RelBE/YafQ-DinJ toxin-antitoxin module